MTVMGRTSAMAMGWYEATGEVLPVKADCRHNCWVGGEFIWNNSPATYECERHSVRWVRNTSDPTGRDDWYAPQSWKNAWGDDFELVDHSAVHAPSPA
jgi:hypothetical protein